MVGVMTLVEGSNLVKVMLIMLDMQAESLLVFAFGPEAKVPPVLQVHGSAGLDASRGGS
jgi:hypothetical protein